MNGKNHMSNLMNLCNYHILNKTNVGWVMTQPTKITP